jgi:hypothetical protein
MKTLLNRSEGFAKTIEDVSKASESVASASEGNWIRPAIFSHLALPYGRATAPLAHGVMSTELLNYPNWSRDVISAIIKTDMRCEVEDGVL